MNKILYIFLFATLFFAACSSDDIPNDKPDGDKQIELRFSVKNFQGESVTRATIAGTTEENEINNLCLFIIKSNSIAHKYYMDENTFDGGSGSWDESNTILLGLTASDVGVADVYVVANAGDITGSITSVSDLNSKKIETTNPWSGSESDNIKTPLIMSGSKLNYDFKSNPVLDAVPLTRAVAKVEIVVTLSEQYQSTPTVVNPHTQEDIDQYKYQLLNFNKNTYLLEGSGGEELFNDDFDEYDDWRVWSGDNDNITAFELNNDGKATKLTFTTYINERSGTGDATTINVILPFWDDGMPPPQFLEDPLPIKLPTKIERNHYYIVAVQM